LQNVAQCEESRLGFKRLAEDKRVALAPRHVVGDAPYQDVAAVVVVHHHRGNLAVFLCLLLLGALGVCVGHRDVKLRHRAFNAERRISLHVVVELGRVGVAHCEMTLEPHAANGDAVVDETAHKVVVGLRLGFALELNPVVVDV